MLFDAVHTITVVIEIRLATFVITCVRPIKHASSIFTLLTLFFDRLSLKLGFSIRVVVLIRLKERM